MIPIYLNIAYTPKEDEEIRNTSECYSFEYILLFQTDTISYICSTDSIVIRTDNKQLSKDKIIREASNEEIKEILSKALEYYKYSESSIYINEWLSKL